MICRFGSTELNAVLTYLIANEKNWPRKLSILPKGGRLNWNNGISFSMSNNAGFFSCRCS
jgi:hypothetical protein